MENEKTASAGADENLECAASGETSGAGVSSGASETAGADQAFGAGAGLASEKEDAPEGGSASFWGESSKEEASPEEGEWRSLLAFDGHGAEYFGIVLKTVIFSVLTLGVYWFWGKTRQRQYLWSHTRLLGEPLEYTGTGKELFLGFIIVFPLLAAGSIGLSLLAQVFPIAILLAYLFLLFCWQYASYRAVRYRLTRSRWRGIRGNLDGNPAQYAFSAMGYMLAAFLSLGLLYPWASGKLAGKIAQNARFGDRKVTFTEGLPGLYGPFFQSILVSAILFILLILASVGFWATSGARHYTSIEQVSTFELLAPMIIAALAFLGTSAGYAIYRAGFLRWFCKSASFGTMRFRSTLSGSQYFGVTFKNVCITAFSLGIATAWAVINDLSVRLGSIEYEGDPALEQLLQDSGEAPKYGEGLLEGLDMDIGL